MTQQTGAFTVATPAIAQRPMLVKDGILYGADALVAAWVSDRLGAQVPTIPFMAFAICADGTPDGPVTDLNTIYLVAGVYWYNHHTGPDCFDISVAVATDDVSSGRPASIRRILEYPFGELKVPRITAEINATNERAIRNAEMLGFKREGLKRKAGAGGTDIVVLGLLPEECPFWNRN